MWSDVVVSFVYFSFLLLFALVSAFCGYLTCMFFFVVVTLTVILVGSVVLSLLGLLFLVVSWSMVDFFWSSVYALDLPLLHTKLLGVCRHVFLPLLLVLLYTSLCMLGIHSYNRCRVLFEFHE